LILTGAREAGLDAAYIEKLEKQPVYEPTADTIAKRKQVPAPADLPKISYEWIKEHAKEDGINHVAIMGYVFRVPREELGFKIHSGRDITARQLRHLHGKMMDPDTDVHELNDHGRPPYPDVDKLTAEEQDYLWQWLDYYLQFEKNCNGDVSCVIGFLQEWDQKK